jgi:hypothetical protein
MNAQVMPELNAAERDMMDQKQATRLQVVLCRADGKRTREIAEVLRIHPVSISVIVCGFNEQGVEGLPRQANHKPGMAPVSLKVIHRILKLVQPNGHTTLPIGRRERLRSGWAFRSGKLMTTPAMA